MACDGRAGARVLCTHIALQARRAGWSDRHSRWQILRRCSSIRYLSGCGATQIMTFNDAFDGVLAGMAKTKSLPS
jgi:hypothetical protein